MKRIKAIASFAAVIFLAIEAIFYGQQWAFNLFAFVSILNAICYFLNTYAVDKTDETLLRSYREGAHLPEWVDYLAYSFLIGLMAAFAHWWLAVCWVLVGTFDHGLRQKAKGAK